MNILRYSKPFLQKCNYLFVDFSLKITIHVSQNRFDEYKSVKSAHRLRLSIRIETSTQKETLYTWQKCIMVIAVTNTWFSIENIQHFFLRVRAFFHKTVRVCHVYCNFKIGFTCRITVIFGTLKDGSLLLSTSVSNIFFSYRNKFQNGVDALSKIVDAFLSKSSKFHLVRIIR